MSEIEHSEGASPSDKKIIEEKIKLQKNAKSYWKSFWKYVKSLLSLREGIDHKGTSDGIRQDVEFKGHAAWILVCSILIASLGLNTNSPAVVIGAMLISPLMGPILGVGFSAGINDWELLKKSMKNFGSTIVISLIISYIYFKLSPIKDLNEELFSRTSASLYAIVVAFLGGAAGIIAGSRKLKSNVVPGVAIATALMPPLCTAGYGLAMGNMNYFLGAFYLFFINSVFIAVPTYLYIRYLKFPVKEFVDPALEKRIKRYILIFLMVVIVPSFITFYNVIQDTIAKRNMTRYLELVELETSKYGAFVISPDFYAFKDSLSCTIPLRGNPIPESELLRIVKLSADFAIPENHVRIIQEKDIESILEEYSVQENSALSQKDKFIQQLEIENQVLRSNIEKSKAMKLLEKDISEEMKSLFPELKFHYFVSDSSEVFIYSWQDELKEGQLIDFDNKLRAWLPKRMAKDSLNFKLLE